MQEVVPPLRALVEGLALGDLVLMVRERQVHAARVDVQPTSEHQAARHGRGGLTGCGHTVSTPFLWSRLPALCARRRSPALSAW